LSSGLGSGMGSSGGATQFIIGGASGVKIQDETVHPLQKINPDGWLNIPVCLVKAVKQLIEANIGTDQRSRAIAGQSENNARKTLT